MRIPQLLTGALFAGCLLAPTARAQETPAEEPCPIAVTGTSEDEWRLVRADGFTFCVPSSWRPSGRAGSDGTSPRTWSRGRSSITWGTGEGERSRAIVPAPRRESSDQPPSPPRMERSREEIGGRTADVWEGEFQGEYFTGASWTNPQVFIIGETRNSSTAKLQLAIYRTVRFTGP
jgi:hypothetical protein